jgi:dipeptidyl aminopeptidase/acylaminoacyl peptidase
MAARRSRRKVTVNEALKLTGIGAPVPSPDGAMVLFGDSRVRSAEKQRAGRIMAVPGEGGRVRKLTNGPRDGSPVWSPDGETIVFVRRPEEDEPAQIFSMPSDGGEPEQLTKLDTGPSALRFARDGKRLGFLAQDPDDRETKRRKKSGDDARVFRVEETVTRLWTVSPRSGKPRAGSPEGLHISGWDWLPDCCHAVVVYSDAPDANAQFFHSRIGIVDTVEGTLEPVKATLKFVAQPEVSPDGESVAVIGGGLDAPWGGEAWLVNLASGRKKCLTPDLRGTVVSLQWLPDGSRLLLTVGEGMMTRLYTVAPSAPGKLEPVCEGLPVAVNAIKLSQDGDTVFAVAESPECPPEIWRCSMATGEAEQLTRQNSFVEDLRLGRREVIAWRSEEHEIEGVLTLPPSYRKGRKYPTVLIIHGGPAGHYRLDGSLLPVQVLASAGYVVLQPNPRGSSGYGSDFVRANFNDWGGGDFRDLMKGVTKLVRDGIADPERLAVYGGSYGGYMTAWTVTQTNRFRCAVCQCGLTDLFSMHGTTDITPDFMDMYFGGSPYDDPALYRERSAMSHLDRVKTPTLFLHGEKDVRVPISQSYQMYWGLRHNGVEVELVVYPREGHGIAEVPHQRDLYGRLLEWLETHMK